MNKNNKEMELHCPRCKGIDLIVYGKIFDCIKCHLEFEIEDLLQFDEDNVLSIEEKLKIIPIVKNE